MLKHRHSLWNSILAIAVLIISLSPSSVYAQRNNKGGGGGGNPIGDVLPAIDHPKFKIPLPDPAVIDATNGGSYTMYMRQTTQWLGLEDVAGNQIQTTIWGYGQGNTVTYPGPTFWTMKDVPINVKWENLLPNTHPMPVDQTLHWAHYPGYPNNGIPTVTHLHGGHTESASDGLPEAWFTRRFRNLGPQFVKKTYHYDNDQESATLWYHDHALGITRLNVYAGLAGFYFLRDQKELDLIANNRLPTGAYEREIVIQDRDFKADGSLSMPAFEGDLFFDGLVEVPPSINDLDYPLTDENGNIIQNEPWPNDPNGPTHVAEFFGNYILVNGVTWPKLNVEPRQYRLRMLNGSDSRFYILKFSNGMSFLQIGSDDGFLENPVSLQELIIAPGERADLIVDFSSATGEIILQNVGPDGPFKGKEAAQAPADPATSGMIMKFIVDQPLNGPLTEIAGPPLNSIDPLIVTNPGEHRNLALFEGMDEYGRLQPLLGVINNTVPTAANDYNENGALTWIAPITENPMLDVVEEWWVYNFTEDAHPVHLHLVSFQIINRQKITAPDPTEKSLIQHNGNVGTGGFVLLSDVTEVGSPEEPDENEMGWKDTFIVPPGYVGRVKARFDRPGRYVWHCHILSHEDHEMMRPFFVGPMGGPGGGIGGAIVETPPPVTDGTTLGQNYPNPFANGTDIIFSLPVDEQIDLSVFNLEGRKIRTLIEGLQPAGNHQLFWDGRDASGNLLPNGVYIYQLKAGDSLLTRKMSLVR